MTDKIEETLAHLTRTVDDLSDVVAAQDAEIQRLSRKVDVMLQREKDRAAESTGGVILGDERPPHY